MPWILFLTSSLVFLERSFGVEDVEAIQPHLRVASFNVQNFGQKKYNKNYAADVIKKIITRYDLICLQEIVLQKRNFLNSLLKDLNYTYSPKRPYAMSVSAAVGTNSTTKEHYVYFYRKDRLELLDVHVYPDPKSHFIRPPYVAQVRSPTTRSLTSFVAICVHTRPSNAAYEINALAEVYDYAKKFYQNDNTIIMGDMNAACKYVRTNDWPRISLWTRPEFLWLVNNSMDTTSYTSSCAYDRIIITGKEMKRDTVYNSVRAFDYEVEYNMTEKLVREISDHYPIEFSLNGKVPQTFLKNIHTDICIRAFDRRPSNDFSLLQSQAARQFDVDSYNDSQGCHTRVIMTKEGTNYRDLISSLKTLKAKTNNFLSSETIETIQFKSEHGSLNDCGSFNPVTDTRYRLTVDCLVTTDTCTVYLCKQVFFN